MSLYLVADINKITDDFTYLSSLPVADARLRIERLRANEQKWMMYYLIVLIRLVVLKKTKFLSSLGNLVQHVLHAALVLVLLLLLLPLCFLAEPTVKVHDTTYCIRVCKCCA